MKSNNCVVQQFHSLFPSIQIKECYITVTLLYKNKLKNVKLYQQLFLLALNSISRAISLLFLHAYKNFWAVFFLLLSAKTGSVRSVLPEIKLVWPNLQTIFWWNKKEVQSPINLSFPAKSPKSVYKDVISLSLFYIRNEHFENPNLLVADNLTFEGEGRGLKSLRKNIL